MGKKPSKSKRGKSSDRKKQKSKRSKKSKHNIQHDLKQKSDASELQLQRQRSAVHIFRLLLSEYPQARKELREMLWKLDDGEAVDVDSMGDRTLQELLREMFINLGLKQLSQGYCRTSKGEKVISILALTFELPLLPAGSAASYLASKAHQGSTDAGTNKPSANAITPQLGPSLSASTSGAYSSDDDSDASPMHLKLSSPISCSKPVNPSPEALRMTSSRPGNRDIKAESGKAESSPDRDEAAAAAPPRKTLGPMIPDAETLAAAQEAAAVFEATGRVRRLGGEGEGELLIGPAPPELEQELGDVPQDERTQEVKRIMSVSTAKTEEDVDAYEVLGVTPDTPVGDVKRWYWKLSLLIHPDKCKHPQAGEAFKRLSLAAKVLQSTTARSALDDRRMTAQMQHWEDEEAEQRERERQWRVVRGEEADTGPAQQGPATREEWMLELPQERRAPAVMSQVSVRSFGRNTTSTGDRSGWTRNPLQPGGPNLPALMGTGTYASTAMLMGRAGEVPPAVAGTTIPISGTKHSLLEKHQEAKIKKKKDKSSKSSVAVAPPDADWVGQHPWRPFDRDKDLGPSLGKAKDAKDLLKGAVQLSSRFASGGARM